MVGIEYDYIFKKKELSTNRIYKKKYIYIKKKCQEESKRNAIINGVMMTQFTLYVTVRSVKLTTFTDVHERSWLMQGA